MNSNRDICGASLRRFVPGAVALVLALLVSAGAKGEEPAEAASPEASALEEKARTLVAARNIVQAIVIYEELYSTTQDTRYLYNIGYLYEDAGQPAVAWDHYQRYLLAAPGGAKVAKLKIYLDELAEKLGEHFRLVHVISSPAGASAKVTTKGAVRHPPGVTPMSIWMPLGEGTIRFDLAGHLPGHQAVQVQGEGAIRVLLTLEPAPVEEPVVDPPSAEESPREEPESGQELDVIQGEVSAESEEALLPLGTWIGGGVAVASLVTAIAYHVVAQGTATDARKTLEQIPDGPGNDDLKYTYQDQTDRAQGHQLAANITFGIAGAAAATGLTFFLIDLLSDDAVEAPAGGEDTAFTILPTVAPVVTDDGVGVLARWRL